VRESRRKPVVGEQGQDGVPAKNTEQPCPPASDNPAMLDMVAPVLRVVSLALASHRFEKLGRQVYLLAIKLMEERADDLAILAVAEKTANASVDGYWPRLVAEPNRDV
jgi:hypothetical protein